MVITIIAPTMSEYAEISRFASEVYGKRLNVPLCAAPDVFACARLDGRIVGCFGLYRAATREKLLIERYVPDAFARISGNESVERRICAEIGTRAVTAISQFSSRKVSLALSASLILYAHQYGISYIGFTSNRTAVALTHALGFSVTTLGSPDVSRLEPEFVAAWRAFFRIKQYCFGFKVTSPAGCIAALESLARDGISCDLSCPC